MDSSPGPGLCTLPTLPKDQSPASRPGLLPAFEPLSSSPFPRAPKRRLLDVEDVRPYPTPVPTSSTAIFTSPNVGYQARTRPALERTMSQVSERMPLGDVPSIDLPEDGTPVLMGRSTNSSNYQLGTDRAISRVHVRATYHEPSSEHTSGHVCIECLGWNGCRVHCKGQAFDIRKGENFLADKPWQEIMLDVQNVRVIVGWPRSTMRQMSTLEESSWEDSPTRRASTRNLASSPPQALARLISPDSPTPTNNITTCPISSFSATFIQPDPDPVAAAEPEPVQIYVDSDAREEGSKTPAVLEDVVKPSNVTESRVETSSRKDLKRTASVFSDSDSDSDLSDRDEENDPLLHSFGPFGANIVNSLNSFTTTSPERRRRPLRGNEASSQQPRPVAETSRTTAGVKVSLLENHVINQLAYSRLHSLPLSTIFKNLPADLKGRSASSDEENDRTPLQPQALKKVLDDVACIGEINRSGKDAAGKPLEDEFYYIPEMDTDEARKSMVMSSKPSMRSTRKQHKQYFWKKPRY